MKYVYFCNDSVVSVTNLETGEVTQFFKGDPRFDLAIEYVKDGVYDAVEALNTKVAINKFAIQAEEFYTDETGVRVTIRDNMGYVEVYGEEYDLADCLTQRIIKLTAEGFDAQPMINFIGNLYQNK